MNFAIFIFLIAGLMVIGEAVKEVKNPLALVLIILGTSLFMCIGPIFLMISVGLERLWTILLALASMLVGMILLCLGELKAKR